MTTEEHLEKILSKCRELLALAEKRTPVTNVNRYENGGGRVFNEDINGKRKLIADYYHEEDREYSIACAGAAEAGWLATIATIGALREHSQTGCPFAARLLTTVIAAWPEELL